MSRSEFDLIQNFKNRFSLDRVGDDCAVLPKDGRTDLLVTADMLVEDIDFRLEWTSAEMLGHKALAVSLSDIAAMGGRPAWAMLTIGIPDELWKTDLLDRFYDGWFSLARRFDVELVGGDISRTPDKIVIDSIVGGDVEKGRAILRSTAKIGDAIFVSGTLGGAAGGLRLLESGHRIKDNHVDPVVKKQLRPQPQLSAANLLQDLNIVTSMIDISDGLSSDLSHICESSRVGAQLLADSIPVDPDLSTHFDTEARLDMALNGGEDLQLLFTVSEENIPKLNSPDFTRVGEITANVGIIELSNAGELRKLPPKGFQHF